MAGNLSSYTVATIQIYVSPVLRSTVSGRESICARKKSERNRLMYNDEVARFQ